MLNIKQRHLEMALGNSGCKCLLVCAICFSIGTFAHNQKIDSVAGVSRADTSSSTSSGSKVEGHFVGSGYGRWTTIKNVKLETVAGRRPILLGIVPRSYSLGSTESSFSVRLITEIGRASCRER